MFQRLPMACIGSLLVGLACSNEVGAQSFVNWETPHVNPIAITPSGNRLLVCNTADNRLEIYDLTSNFPVHRTSVAVGLDPVSVRARNDGEAWVVNHVSDSISIIDLNNGRVVRTIDTGDEPADVVFAGSPMRAFVTVSQLNQVRVFDPANPAAAPQTIAIAGEDPRALAVSADGTKVYAAIFESGNKSTVIARNVVSQPGSPYNGQNPPPNSGNTFSPPIGPAGLGPPNTMIVKQNGGGQWMDDNNRNWTAFVTWGLHDHDVAIIDAASLAVTYASGMMNMVANLAVAPDGTVTAVGTDAINEVRFVQNVNSIFVRCTIGSLDPASPASVITADLNPHLGNYAVRTIAQNQRDLSIGDPRGIVWHPSRKMAYITGMGSNNVIVADAAGTRLAQINIGEGPTGLAINAAGTRLYVLNKFDGSVSVIDTAAETEIARISFFDPTPATIKVGRPFLYNTHLTSGLGQASCASCHIDGRTDHLGWDLGDPAGSVIIFDEQCQGPAGPCINWHPMKGNMVTQTMQGIVGNEPLHWRGEKENLADFNVAFTDLQSRDTELTPAEMTLFENFIATITYPPNPYRNIDSTLPNVLAVTGGTGNANIGRNIYLTQPVLPGGLRCVDCHSLPNGTNNRVDIPAPGEPQNRKNAQLRNMYDKTGFDRTSQQSNRGFGFDHDGDEDTIFTLLSQPGFNFANQQQRRDVEAFVLSLSTDTPAGVGAQTTVLDGSAVPANQQTLLNQMTALADVNAVGLVVKGRQGELDRGYRYNGGGSFQSDRVSETLSSSSLLASASSGSELTYTLVPIGSQTRIGIDRDSDGFFDRDELDACSDPADAAITPLNVCVGDIAPSGGDGTVSVPDLLSVISQWAIPGGSADIAPNCGDGNVGVVDLLEIINRWGPCQ